MSKKRKYLIAAVLTLCMLVAVGGTVAFMFKRANKKNTFEIAKVTCKVHEKMDETDVITTEQKGNKKSDICVENTGNIKEFIRIRLVSYYVGEDGKIVGMASSEYPAITLQYGWIAGKDHTYYYPDPVDPNGKTQVLCAPFNLVEKTLEDGTKVKQVVEVFAEAIQAEPGDAANEAWGVTVSGGKIIAVPTTSTTP